MKKYLLSIALSLYCASAWANPPGFVGGTAISGESNEFVCSGVVGSSAVGTIGSGYNVGSSSTLVYVGQVVNAGQSDKHVCSSKVWARSITGNISAKSYTMQVWSTSGGNRSTVKGTSNTVSGANIAAGGYTPLFTFSTPVVINPTDAIVITADSGAIDAANYLQVGYISSDVDSAYSNRSYYNASGVSQSNSATVDIGYVIYE